MKKYLFFLLSCFLANLINAQSSFFSAVKIEFEKTEATRALYKELFPEWFDEWKDHIAANTVHYYDFISDSVHSIFKPGREVTLASGMFDFISLANKNTVYTDFQRNISITQKPIFEETFLVQDSLLNIKWKITPDTRTIAGFECRKAIGIVFDTVAVFAFYTDELMIPGGPEGIHGLPGMILGMGIPRLHTTWFATKVQVVDVPTTRIQPEKKGKKSNRKDMLESLDNVLKNWEDWKTFGKKLVLATQI